MKKIILFTALLSCIMFLSGCVTSTVERICDYPAGSKYTADGKMVVADLEATNYTSFLFGLLPIVSGSHTLPNAWQYSMWRDNVSNRKTRSMMNWYSQRVMKCGGVENFKAEYEWIGWPTLWIVSWKKVRATAQAVKK